MEDVTAFLPEETREQFEAHYAKSPPIEVQSNACNRCGVVVGDVGLHAVWHKNVSVQLWLFKEYVHEHTRNHGKLNYALSQLTDILTGEEEPSG